MSTRTAAFLPPSGGTIRVAGWNIQHLGSRRPRRTHAQLSAISERLTALGSSIYVLQEIESLPILQSVAEMLGPTWSIYFERRNSNALLYDSSAVDLLKADILKSLDDMPYPGSISRKPVRGVFESQSGQFQVLGVHFHWSKDEVRKEEARWITAAARQASEPLLIFGDFNAEPYEEPHQILAESLMRLPKQNGDSTLLPFGLHFDHIYVNAAAHMRIADGHSVIVQPDLFGDSMRETLSVYSDHLAVYADIAT